MNTLRKFWRREGAPFLTLLALSLFLTLPIHAQDQGAWRASNSTARSITGDVDINGEKLMINLVRFPVSRIRALEPAEVSAAFDADTHTPGAGSLYSVNISGGKQFLNHNTLCGTEKTQWMATYAQGRSLKLAFFSGQKPPVFTLEALANSSDLCGTFVYVK
jgi:hypothetical protein